MPPRSPMLPFLVPAMVAVLVGLLAARAASRLRPRATIGTVHREVPLVSAAPAVTAILIGLLIASQAYDPMGRRLPLWVQRWAPDLIWIGILAAASFLAAFLAGFGFCNRRPRRGLLLVLMAAIVAALGAVAWRGRRPLAAGLAPERAVDGYVRQTTLESCAAAALATIASLNGVSTSEQEAARLMRTTASGTTPGQIRYGLSRLGFAFSDIRQERPDLGAVQAPAILFVHHPSVGPRPHTVVYLGRRGASYEIWDPLLGLRAMSAGEVNDIWSGRGLRVSFPLRT